MKKIIYILILWILVKSTDAQMHPLKSGYTLPNFKYETIQGSKLSNQNKQGFIQDISSLNFKNTYRFFRDQENHLLIKVEGNYIIQNTQNPLVYINQYIESIINEMGISNSNELLYTSKEHDEITNQTFYRFTQYFQGVQVFGGEWIVVTKGKIIEFSMGRIYHTPLGINTHAILSTDQVLGIAKTKLSDLTTFETYTNEQINILGPQIPEIKKYIYYNELGQNPKLSYRITIHPNLLERYVFTIDAMSGEIIDYFNHTCAANGPRTATGNDLNGKSRNINTYEYNNRFYAIDAAESMFSSSQSQFPDDPVGVIWTLDANNTDGSGVTQLSYTNNTSWNAKTISAHYNAKLCYDYYKYTHNRNSINGAGGNIISIINVTSNGSQMDNAYWNGQAMFYGNGKVAFKPLAGAIDVAGHEMTHGVVEKTANLEYKNQSGAMNESMADIFGAMIENNNWKMGEDVVKTAYFPSGALRDLSNPHNGGNNLNDNGWQPAYMKEFYSGTNDNGGVHINSGITNFAYYLFATKVTKAKAEKVYYRALTKYLTSTSKFLDLRYAVVQSCKDLYTATEEAFAKWAFDSVQIYDPNGSSGGSANTSGVDLPTNTGTSYIISYDVNYSGTNNRWYRSSTVPDNFLSMTTTKTKQPMSIQDNGSFGYFIGWDSKMHKISLSSFSETIVQNQAIWDNVAISKDGNKIAAVTTSIDSSIWIYDGTNWNRFYLYNPTTANGVNSAGVLYAGAIEWDYTGEYVMYDAYNIIPNQGGNAISYWDVGLIKVWNNKTNSIGDGKVSKVFSNLPSDISIGNPAISRNSPYIVAFDYIDNSGSNTQYMMIAANLITQKTTSVYTNTMLSFPNYSRTDNKILFTTEDSFGDTILASIGMNSDKITPVSGSAAGFISDAKWGNWVTQGTRKLLSSDKDIIEFKFLGINPQLTTNISGTTITGNLPSGVDPSSLIATFKISPLATAYVAGVEQISGVNANNFSTTIQYVIQAQDGTSQTYNISLTIPKSNKNDLLSYSFQSLNPKAIGTISGNTVSLVVPSGTNVSNLTASFTVSPKALVKISGTDQISGNTANNFTNPVTYTIIAEDGSTKNYIVTVTINNGQLSSAKDITAFSFNQINPPVQATINGTDILAFVSPTVDLSNLVATFTLSNKSNVFVNNILQNSGSTANNFMNPLTYTVKAEDGSLKDYQVTVQKLTGIHENIPFNSFIIFPNPSHDKISIQSENLKQWSIYNPEGKVILNGTLQNSVEIDISAFAKGLYIVEVKNESLNLKQKLIIQ